MKKQTQVKAGKTPPAADKVQPHPDKIKKVKTGDIPKSEEVLKPEVKGSGPKLSPEDKSAGTKKSSGRGAAKTKSKAAPEKKTAVKTRTPRPKRTKKVPASGNAETAGEPGLSSVTVEPVKPVPVTESPARPVPVLKDESALPPVIPVEPQEPQPVATSAPAEPVPVPQQPSKTKIRINEITTVRELADLMKVSPAEIIKKLLDLGTMATINQRIDPDAAALVAGAFNFDLVVTMVTEEPVDVKEDKSKLSPRPPVVTVMGHVDHGKTSLLDAIRQTKVAEQESGGITQHIGAYQAGTGKNIITFFDTPGHEAFTALRARGAQVTDIVILVVAADDGVMPQTVEAIDHARAAGVPIIVAINKIDMPGANPNQVKQQLAKYDLVPEDWGGKTIMVEVSAKNKINLDKLLEMILLETEMLELKANPDRPASGAVIEAKLDSRRGPVATLLVQKGALKIGDIVVCGFTFGRVRAMADHTGKRLTLAMPSTPLEILGLAEPPQAGDKFAVVSSERDARTIVEKRRELAKTQETQTQGPKHLTLEILHEAIEAGKVKELPVIIKADVQGSVEALTDSLMRLAVPEVKLKIIHAGVGSINESDIILAAASDAVIVGFNVKTEPRALEAAQNEGVEIRNYKIIYDVVKEVKAAIEGLLEPTLREVLMGKAEVKKVFPVSKIGFVAGSMIYEGKVVRGMKARIRRAGAVVHEGSISGLKRFKDDVREVEKGYECGIFIEGAADVQPGDIIEAFSVEKLARKLT